MRFRIGTGDSMALLHVSSTTVTMGHNTSRVVCPEKSNKDGDPGKLTEGFNLEKRLWMNMTAVFYKKGCHCSRRKNKDQRRVIDVIM